MRFADIIQGLVEGKRYMRPNPDYTPGDRDYCMVMGPDGYIVILNDNGTVYIYDGYETEREAHEMHLPTIEDLLAEDWEEVPE